jgi:hypothetical protein
MTPRNNDFLRSRKLGQTDNKFSARYGPTRVVTVPLNIPLTFRIPADTPDRHFDITLYISSILQTFFYCNISYFFNNNLDRYGSETVETNLELLKILG